MRIRKVGLHVLGLIVFASILGTVLQAQRPKKPTAPRVIHTATSTKATLFSGRLNPERSGPGDQISLRLTEDVKSNGRVVIKKGSVLTGVVRSVVQIDPKRSSAHRPQSMMEIQWLPPSPVADGTIQLMVALQSFTYANTAQSEKDKPVETMPAPAPVPAVSDSRINGKTNAAVMSMPFIVAVDEQTSMTFEDDFGISNEDQIYRTGQGDMLTIEGARQSVALFSRLSNDTLITSAGRDFNIGTGAEMQLLFGVERR